MVKTIIFFCTMPRARFPPEVPASNKAPEDFPQENKFFVGAFGWGLLAAADGGTTILHTFRRGYFDRCRYCTISCGVKLFPV